MKLVLNKIFGIKNAPETGLSHAMNRKDIRPAPVDPTLEAASREVAVQIAAKAAEIKTISDDIVSMTNALLDQYRSRDYHEKNPPQ